MRKARLAAWARQFPENGMKFLLEDPRNVEELFDIQESSYTRLIDFAHLTREPTTFVLRDYRHVEADVVLTAPLLPPPGAQPRRRVWLYLLLEHQSKPDPLMSFRLLEYVLQLFRSQLRGKTQKADFKFQPVLPMVFYTGPDPWDRLKSLCDVMEMGHLFRPVTPILDPLFLSLRDVAPAHLSTSGGYLGQVLRLVQAKNRHTAAFEALLEEVVERLEALAPAERRRWQEFLSYIFALVYHTRTRPEREHLYEVIESSVRHREHQREVHTMGQTIAQYLKAEGRKEGRKEGEVKALQATLILLLRQRFGTLPEHAVADIQRTEDAARLIAWLKQVYTVQSLSDMNIGS